LSVSQSRRALLKGRLSPPSPVLRPPWASPDGFEHLCTRCGQCEAVCPSGIIRKGDAGYPIIEFKHGECTFCGNCVDACDTGALLAEPGVSPWSITANISDDCLAYKKVECRVCGEVCGEAAIVFRPALGGPAKPQLVVERCTGCGACVAPCPVSAISVTGTRANTRANTRVSRNIPTQSQEIGQ
jgi:ferredoxin-type protein NapF